MGRKREKRLSKENEVIIRDKVMAAFIMLAQAMPYFSEFDLKVAPIPTHELGESCTEQQENM